VHVVKYIGNQKSENFERLKINIFEEFKTIGTACCVFEFFENIDF